MNSSRPLEKGRAPLSVPARLLSNWVEIFAIPVAAAIMETQPLLLGLELIRPFLLGGGDVQIPGALSITLSLLLMQWWAMFLQARGKDSLLNNQGRPALRTLSGLPFIALLIVVIQPGAPGDGDFLFSSVALLVWSWYRGVLRANDPLNDAYLTSVFRVGFAVLLVVLGFAFLTSLSTDAARNTLSDALTRPFPIFFLSSLIALSFTRMGKLKREQQRYPGSNSEATGRWLSGLTITWILLALAAVALEALPLSTIMMVLNPLWWALSLLGLGVLTLVGLVMYVFLYLLGYIAGGVMWLLNQIFHFSNTLAADQLQQKANAIAPVVQKTGQQSPLLTIILAVGVIILVLVVFFSTTCDRKREDGPDVNEYEVRESLNREAILQERREQRRKPQEALALEALDPTSMRARYREFLQEMATQGEETQRRPNETPLEYQRRLFGIAQRRHLLRDEQDAELLNELTLAYARERYGGKRVADEQQRYRSNRVVQLARKFAGVATVARPVSTWSAEKAR